MVMVIKRSTKVIFSFTLWLVLSRRVSDDWHVHCINCGFIVKVLLCTHMTYCIHMSTLGNNCFGQVTCLECPHMPLLQVNSPLTFPDVLALRNCDLRACTMVIVVDSDQVKDEEMVHMTRDSTAHSAYRDNPQHPR